MKNKLLIFSMNGFLLVSNASNAKDLAEIRQDLQAVASQVNAQNIKKFGPIVLAGAGAVGLGYYIRHIKQARNPKLDGDKQQDQVGSTQKPEAHVAGARVEPPASRIPVIKRTSGAYALDRTFNSSGVSRNTKRVGK